MRSSELAKTHQGVRDLNNRSSNGRTQASCPHHRAPDAVATDRVEEMRLVDGRPRGVSVYYCAACGQERWNTAEDDTYT